jgi:hypothetical protein
MPPAHKDVHRWHFARGGCGGIRTHTLCILSALSLPLEYTPGGEGQPMGYSEVEGSIQTKAAFCQKIAVKCLLDGGGTCLTLLVSVEWGGSPKALNQLI